MHSHPSDFVYIRTSLVYPAGKLAWEGDSLPTPLDVNPIPKDQTMTPKSDFNPRSLPHYEQEVLRLLTEILNQLKMIASQRQ